MATLDTATAFVEGNLEEAMMSFPELSKSNPKAAKNAAYINTMYFKKHKDRLAIGELLGESGYTKEIAESWNNREYVTQEESIALGRDFNLSENVSNATKSTFTKAFIETAENDNIRACKVYQKFANKEEQVLFSNSL